MLASVWAMPAAPPGSPLLSQRTLDPAPVCGLRWASCFPPPAAISPAPNEVGSKPAPTQEETWHAHRRFTSKRAGLSLCRRELGLNQWHQWRNWAQPEESTGPEPVRPGDVGGPDPRLAAAGATSNCPLLFSSRAG